MAEEPIPDDVRNFLFRHIDSVTQLEALLLLHRIPKEMWDLPKIASRLYAREREVLEVLTRLCGDGIISCKDGIYRYDDQSPARRATVASLAETYKTHLIPITNIVHAKPRRVREFADAFKFRRE